MSPPLVEELAVPPDPVETCERFLDLPYLLFLDSATDPGRLGRHSFLAADPALVIRSKGTLVERLVAGRVERVLGQGQALELVRELLARHRAEAVPGLPPFQGGMAGYIGYDWGAVLERLPAPRYDDLALPDVMLGLYDWVIAWDHRANRAWVISTGVSPMGEAGVERAGRRMRWVLDRLEGRRRPADEGPGPPRFARTPVQPAPSFAVDAVPGAGRIGLRSAFTHRGYLDAVSRVRDYIVAGDIFQANLSQRLEADYGGHPWGLYRRLRRRNPAPFAAYLAFGDLTVVSASPERFLRVDREGLVETRPIKGTRPRGSTPEQDAALARSLLESEKDRAENLMIVDLLRNDLSRVCRPGSVRVPELFALESWATVHHLVSTVVGRLAPGADAADLLAAAFPGGSITGAPKVRAMEIIAELEPSRRGVYCGSIGYLSPTGAMDTSIVIRTVLHLGERVYFSVGGGIVADSDPEQEYRETLDKARAIIEVLGAGDP
ncbi:MAG TPA: aminodeoxychorismate synthase component I [Gemmatimonadales bacterium]|nr:aminodeoxychorismate synthase component I [Gemmatimonadales bacterium]